MAPRNLRDGDQMDVFTSIWEKFSGALMSVLPTSPFADTIASISEIPYLSYINWFFPFGTCVQIFGVWLTAYGVYLFYSIVMRWLKVSGS